MPLQKHSVSLRGHKTSISLEKEFWDILKKLAQEKNKSLSLLIAEIEEETRASSIEKYNLSSSLRIYILKEILKAGSSYK